MRKAALSLDVPPRTQRFVRRRDGNRCCVDDCRAARHLAPTRMVELVPARTMTAPASLRMFVVGVVLELPADTPPEYVGRVLCAARAAC